MTIRLNGATSGYTEIDAPSAAGSNTLILPTGNGSASQYLQTNGTGTLSWNDPFRMVLMTNQPSTTGTSIEFPSIPSWAKRITVMFSQVSTGGTNNILVQIGAGSYTTSGYVSTSASVATGGTAATSRTEGFNIIWSQATQILSGQMILSTLGSNIWVASHSGKISTTNNVAGGGDVTLSGTLDRLRIIASSTGAPADSFDNGNINVMYEG